MEQDMTERTYDVPLTATQIYDFSALVRRLTRIDGGDSRPLRVDLADALESFAALLPEPSDADADADADAYLAAQDAGEVTHWAADTGPLTQTLAEYEAALLATVTKA